MSLARGTRLGPYEIGIPLGAGGMGEVYGATDTKLGREVAIKVLPAEVAADAERLARFEREAKLLASLNHPNVAHVYGFESATLPDGSPAHFLAMELVPGEDLGERLKRGAIPVEEAIAIAKQIAEGLEEAHEKGIVHRDLKPANIKLTPDGKVKVLDFGLAKAYARESASGSSADLSQSPTLAHTGTQAGVILGTAAYMSPEQARGKPVDKRADIWAFGVVLFEMLTGKRLFAGETASDVLAAVITRDPDWSALPADVPSRLCAVLRDCFVKDPKQRLRDIGMARIVLEKIIAGAPDDPGGVPGQASLAPSRPAKPWRAVSTVASIALVVSLALWGPWRRAPAHTHVVSRFQYSLPLGQAFTRPGRHTITVSPDGTKIAYVANERLYLRAMDDLEAEEIRGTNEDPYEPVFSPDGRWLAYFVPSKSVSGGTTLRKIPVAGGAPVTLCQTESGVSGVSWRNDTIAFGQNVSGKLSAIHAVPDAGGAPRALVSVDPKQGRAVQPQLLDDGRQVLFTIMPVQVSDEGQIVVQALDGSPRKLLTSGGMNAQLLPSGQLLYIHDGTLFAMAFDAERLAVTGGPVPVVEGVAESLVSSAGQYAVSREGTLAYVPGRFSGGQRVLVWVDPQGKEQPIAAPPRGYQNPRLSPDGTRIAVGSFDEEHDVWIWDLARETLTRLTFGPASDDHPLWMPDGRHVVFSSNDAGRIDLFRKASDGTGVVEPLTKDGSGGVPQTISPDGRLLVYRTSSSPYGLRLLPLDGNGQSTPLLVDPSFSQLNASISPDSRWIAYESDESKTTQVYVRPFPAVDAGRWMVSSGGSSQPVWSPSGRELFFSERPRRFMKVAIQPGLAFGHGKPQPLFDVVPYLIGRSLDRAYDVAADGRVLTSRAAGSFVESPAIVVVTHWFEELRARMGGK